MYYPYLRARQFELIALRELAAEQALQGYVVPVLEPVKESIGNLILANRAMLEHDLSSYLILNPIIGEMAGDHTDFTDFLLSLEESAFLPAFHYIDNADFIKAMIAKGGIKNCMLICYSSFTDGPEFRNLCSKEVITHIMVLDAQKNRSLERFIKALGKTYIRLDDVFEKQERNADFLRISAHKFTEEHKYYLEEGYQGFSDFTVLPGEYVEGGSTPRAVVIHLTYINKDAEDEVWIRHFTSSANSDSIVDVQGKFAEAAEKAILFCDENAINNSAIEELRGYNIEKRYPGLGIVKKISIKNHLLTISGFLQ